MLSIANTVVPPPPVRLDGCVASAFTKSYVHTADNTPMAWPQNPVPTTSNPAALTGCHGERPEKRHKVRLYQPSIIGRACTLSLIHI